jgi:hypothetical protein
VLRQASDCLVGDYDSTFREQILDVSEAQCAPEIEQNRLLKDLGREPITRVAYLRHHNGSRHARRAAALNRATMLRFCFAPLSILVSSGREPFSRGIRRRSTFLRTPGINRCFAESFPRSDRSAARSGIEKERRNPT